MKHVNFSLISLISLFIVAMSMIGCSSSKEISEADMMKHQIAVERLQARKFIIKANRLILDKHSLPSVSPSTNFIQVDGDQAIVQVSPGLSGGPNGVGGFTVKGSVSGYEVNVKSNGAATVKFNVTASVGSCTVFINLPKGSYVSNTTINSTFRGKNATMFGTISPIDNTVFVGRSR